MIMDVQDTLEILSTMSLRSCSHNSLRNYFKISAEEIKTLREQLANGKRLLSEQMELTNERTKLCIELRAKVASADVLVEALRKVDKHLDAMKCNEDNIEVGLALGLVIDKALATYDKISEVKK